MGPEARPDVTREGIARSAGVALRHVTQYVRPLLLEGLVRERMSHVEGVRQRRRVYDLTDQGRLAAIRLRDRVRSETVRVRDGAGVREETVAEVLAAVKGSASLLDVLRHAKDADVVDLAALVEARGPSFVEMTAGKPDVQRFVGRQRELRLVTEEPDGARFFVLRGVAGIGKTWLAAEACTRLRGTRNLFWHRVRPWDTRQSILVHAGEFLAALGKPALRAVLARGHAERVPDILQRDLTGSRSLLVFDDAHEATDEARPVFRMLLEALEHAIEVRVLLLSRRAVPVYDRRNVVLQRLVREIDLAGLDSQDVAAFLSMDGGPVLSAPFRRSILRHPLLLELYRARREVPALAGGDVRRYIEEVLYAELPTLERRMMAVASLYEVPVPREALFADPEWSHDVLLALENRGLIRPLSDGRFETHDAIREAFRALLAPAERKAYGGFTAGQLRGLAAEAWAGNRFALCADYLSNALRLADDPAEKVTLWERLADAQARMGDLLALSVSYREAIRGSTDPLTVARFHRKLAAALCAHGEFEGALAETDAGFRSLGEAESVERAWLELVQARIANRKYDFRAGREHGEAALRAFRASGDVQGETEADLELGDATSILGTTGPDGAPLADGYYEDAIRRADSLTDPVLAVNARVSLATRIGHRHGDTARVSALLDEAAARSEALGDPFVTANVLLQRGWAKAVLRADFAGSVPDLTEALLLTNEVHDANEAAEVKFILGCSIRLLGRVSEARPLLEEAGREMARLGIHPDRCLYVLAWAAECYLVEGDGPGFRRLLASFDGLGLTKEEWTHLSPLRGFERVLDGEFEAAKALFEKVIRTFEGTRSGEGQFYAIILSGLEFYYGAALESMGEEREATAHRERALEMFRVHNFQNRLVTAEDRWRGIVEGIRRIRAPLGPPDDPGKRGRGKPRLSV